MIDITNDEDATDASLSLESSSSTDGTGKKTVLFFYADWHAPSASGGPFDMVVKTLAQQSNGNVQFYRVAAEEAPKLSSKHEVTTVPTFLFLNADGSLLDRIDGGEDVARVTQCYSKLASAADVLPSRSSDAQTTQNERDTPKQQQSPAADQRSGHQPQLSLDDRLKSLITSSPIVLFQKGTPSAPKCGFSRQAIEILNAADVSFGSFNILEDDEVRQELKTYSDWPTYPQLYVRGELVGGLDIMKELGEEEGGLVEQLELEDFVIKSAEKEQTLNERIEQLINRHKIMVFIKGIPSAPRCGFSRQIVEVLDSCKVSYDAFNILEDEDVRQGLKTYSDWPTFPQLYVEGELVGGLDIVKELNEGDELEEVLNGN